MVYANGGNWRKLIVMLSATEAAGVPTGGINCECSSRLAEQAPTWGSLKTLYR